MASMWLSFWLSFFWGLLIPICDAKHGSDAFERCQNAADGYDFIIVGGGTAGTALATRLSQRLDDCILLIEAGPAAPDELKINVPAMRGAIIGTKYDWNLTTVPQEHAFNRSLPQSRGKVLGGSEAMNLMVWDRASKAEYDAWEELGNEGWNWDSMFKYMLRAENFTGANTSTYGSAGVTQGGPTQALISRIFPAFQTYFLPTMRRFGIKPNTESLDGDPLGAMYQPMNADPVTWSRSYTPNSYLPLARKNLKVLTDTRVSRILLERRHGKLHATGIVMNGTTNVRANKEVIISAGSFQSPGLLELSGIGQQTVLQRAGIEPLLELPGVGENLQDHVRVSTVYELASNYSGKDRLRYDTAYAADQLQQWKEHAVSRYDESRFCISLQTWQQAAGEECDFAELAKRAVGNSTSVVDQKKLGYLTTNRSSLVPELEVILSDGYNGLKGYPANTSALYGRQFTSMISAVQHPLSRGTVHINSSSVESKPVIDPNYMSNEYDREAITFAAKHNRKFAETYPLRQAWVSEYEPGLDVVKTDAEWRAYALNNTLTLYHPVGTCAMLPKKHGGVVDPSLKVYGTSNVRVVDASIMPIIISAHMQTAVLGIAEKAADMIVHAHRAH